MIKYYDNLLTANEINEWINNQPEIESISFQHDLYIKFFGEWIED